MISSKILMLAAPFLSSFLCNIVTASPLDNSENLGLLDNAFNFKRQVAATCFHEADPQNSCRAIADGPGWCDCNNDGKTYAIMNTQNPCGWTTLPPTTTFNCDISASVVPSNSVVPGDSVVLSTSGVPPPPGPPAPPAPSDINPTSTLLACTMTDRAYGVGRLAEITHICNCNDGSKPKATVSAGEYRCPAQVKVVSKRNTRSEYNGIDVSGFR